MPNSFFQFKQFTVFQDKCAMKVCTDACLFGALLPPIAAGGGVNVLDIGTGTGLLSLMFAQKNPGALVDSVEIDAEAAEQAKANFTASPWKERLQVFNADILEFSTNKRYGLIVSNPPFFEDDLRSPDQTKNNAKHDTSLSLAELLAVVKKYLSAEGTFAVLLPDHRVNPFIREANRQGLYLSQQVLVKQTVNHGAFRGILLFSRIKGKQMNSAISIKDAEGNYSDEFVEALKDYYLYL